MAFDSLAFLIFIIIAIASCHASRQTSFYPVIIFAINIIFLMSFAHPWTKIIPLFLFMALGYGLVQSVSVQTKKPVLGVYVSVVILAFIYLKRYSIIDFLPPLAATYTTIGLSYILFRIIQLLVDKQGGDIKEKISPLTYFNFICFFLNFISGPIQRFQDYIKQLRFSQTHRLSEKEAFEGLSRVITGFLKVMFWASFVYFYPQYHDVSYVAGKIANSGIAIKAAWFSFAIITYTLSFYLNFSGYMDIVIGLGRLVCFKVPENFDRPFSSNNFLDFWARWHITLADWFKFYLFNPLLKAMMHRWSSAAVVPYLGVIAYFVTFFVMGIWHGTTVMFVIYGLFLGLGVSINKLYQVLMREWMGKKGYSSLTQNSGYIYLSRGFTWSYFCLALTCLWLNPDQLTQLFAGSIGAVLLTGFVIVGFFFAVAIYIWDSCAWGVSRMVQVMKINRDQPVLKNIWLALKLLFVVYIILVSVNPAPAFVYQAF